MQWVQEIFNQTRLTENFVLNSLRIEDTSWTKGQNKIVRQSNIEVFVYLSTELLLKLSHKPNMNLAESFSQSKGNMDNNSPSVHRRNVAIIEKKEY